MAKEMIAVMCRCGKSEKLFGVRFDTDNGKDWEAAWAFPLKEGADKREKGYSVSVKGNFTISTDYPHCPHCGNPSVFLCGTCGKLTCWDGITKRVVYALPKSAVTGIFDKRCKLL